MLTLRQMQLPDDVLTLIKDLSRPIQTTVILQVLLMK